MRLKIKFAAKYCFIFEEFFKLNSFKLGDYLKYIKKCTYLKYTIEYLAIFRIRIL